MSQQGGEAPIWARAPIGRGPSFLPQEFEIRILKTLATIFRPARRSSRHPSRAYPPSDDLQSWPSERQATSEPDNQKQSLAAAIFACLLTTCALRQHASLLLLYHTVRTIASVLQMIDQLKVWPKRQWVCINVSWWPLSWMAALS